jgi:xanthine dehydrogenase small subunit
MQVRPIRFVHRGRATSVAGVETTRTLLDWLREDARCTGTKEGCAEGDCGACTVLVGELRGDCVDLRGVNACTTFLPAVDGKAVITVEDLGDGAALHPVQQAMLECHGSQCGFCTPGFVMSLAGCYEQHLQAGTRPTRAALADALAGNLCRCTGYRPILEAGQRMFELPVQRLPLNEIGAALRGLCDQPALAYVHAGHRFCAPRTLADFATLRLQHPQARVLAGGTDVALWVNKQLRELGDVLYISAVDELKRIEAKDGLLTIGAAVTLEDAWAALHEHWPSLQALWLRFGSPPVRNAGTLAGNLANGSPIGDGAPVLIALNARLKLRRGDHTRLLELDDFYIDYMKNKLDPGEFIEAIEVPLGPVRSVRAYKLSKRFDSDISALCGAFALQVDAGGVVREARLAFGGMAATVKRAERAERALVGQPWTEATLQSAQNVLAQDFSPITDLRASAEYRLHAARALLQRLWLETRPSQPLLPAELDVWHEVRVLSS